MNKQQQPYPDVYVPTNLELLVLEFIKEQVLSGK